MATWEFGDEYEIREDSATDLVVEHTPSGTTFTYDKSADEWTASDLNLSGNLTDSAANTIADFAGTNLSVDGSNVLNASGADTRANVSDSGTEVVTDVDDINFDSNLNVTDDGDNSVTVDSVQHTQSEVFAYDPGMTEWEDGLSSEEIGRIVLQSGETLTVERIEFRQKGGGSSTSASIDVRDTTAASTIGSADLGATTVDPGSSGSANTVIIRVNNSTGSSINATPRVHGVIE